MNSIDFSNEVVIHCKTEAEALECCEFLNCLGLTWKSKEPYKNNTKYNFFEAETCYDFKTGTCGSKKTYQEEGYKVLEWSEL